MRQFGGRRLDAHLQLVRRQLQLLVEPGALERFAPVVQDGDDRRQLARFGQHLAGDRLDRNRLAGVRVDQTDLAAPDFAGAGLAEQQAGDERREVRVVRLHAALGAVGRVGRRP